MLSKAKMNTIFKAQKCLDNY